MKGKKKGKEKKGGGFKKKKEGTRILKKEILTGHGHVEPLSNQILLISVSGGDHEGDTGSHFLHGIEPGLKKNKRRKGKEREGKGRKGKEREGKGRKGKEREGKGREGKGGKKRENIQQSFLGYRRDTSSHQLGGQQWGIFGAQQAKIEK